MARPAALQALARCTRSLRGVPGALRARRLVGVAAGTEATTRRAMAAQASATMDAVSLDSTGGAEVLKLRQVPKPTPGPGQLIVRNQAIGVNFIDTYHRTGLYPVKTPFTLGVEGAGTVEEVADDVKDFKVGDTVAYVTRPSATEGSYAEYTAVSSNKAYELPKGMTVEDGATISLQGLTALSLVTTAYHVQKGDWVLVHAAAGGVGQLLVQLSTLKGGRVIGTVSNEDKAQIAKSLGAEEVLITGKQDIAGEVRRITSDKGVAVVYDGVGKATFQASLDSVRPLGSLICFGNASGKVDPIDISILAPKNVRLMRTQLYGFITTKEEFQALTSELVQAFLSGHLKVSVHKAYPLAEAGQAHTDLEGRRTTGSLLLKP